jgi:dTDP-4-amino-4,6-dideoxygalactose transaminase
MCPAKLEAAITPRTKAIIPIHLYGMPADMDGIKTIADRHGLPIIEDAPLAHGARYCGKRVGQFGQLACFSFYPSNNLGAYGKGGPGENDAAIAHRARRYTNTHRIRKVGYNYRMDSFQAAVLAITLTRLDAWKVERADRAAHHTELLNCSSYKLPPHFSDSEGVCA